MNKFLYTFLSVFFPLLLSSQITPDFTFNDSDDINHELYADYLDQDKVVFIEFMFISCPPCKAYLPYMKDLYAEFGSGNEDVEFFHFTTVFGDSNADMANYKTDESIPFPMVGSDGSSLPTFNEYKNGDYGTFFGTPTFAIIKPNGEVKLARPSGNQSTWNPVLSDLINEALENDPPPPPPPATFNISGTVLGTDGQTYSSNAAGSGVVVTLSGDTTLTTTDNPFTFENITEGMDVEISVESTTDLALDGISTFDIVLVSQDILGFSDLSLIQRIAADANCSGSISTFDIIILRQLILYLTDSIPCGNYRVITEASLSEPNATVSSSFDDKVSITNLSEDLNNQNLYLIKIGNIN